MVENYFPSPFCHFNFVTSQFFGQKKGVGFLRVPSGGERSLGAKDRWFSIFEGDEISPPKKCTSAPPKFNSFHRPFSRGHSNFGSRHIPSIIFLGMFWAICRDVLGHLSRNSHQCWAVFVSTLSKLLVGRFWRRFDQKPCGNFNCPAGTVGEQGTTK